MDTAFHLIEFFPLQGVSHHLNGRSSIITHKVGFSVSNARPNFSCSVSMADGQSNNNGKLKLNQIMDKAREIWNGLPEPVKSFPWNRVLDNFIQLILDVVVAVIKFLSVPILAISSLSEMSYCARERKLFFVPVPFALGFSVAGILKDTAQEFSPLLKVHLFKSLFSPPLFKYLEFITIYIVV